MYFQKYFNMNYNKAPDHGDNMVNVEEALKYWNFREAKETVRTMVAAYGEPNSMSICDAVWDYAGGFRICIKDESVPHGDHKDFLYGCKQIPVPPDLHTPLALASESIMIDAQRGIVKARCNSVAVVAIMLGFVEDVVSGQAKPTSDELERRIENVETPNWFEDRMGEIMSESINEATREDTFKRMKKAGFKVYSHPVGNPTSMEAWYKNPDFKGYLFQVDDKGNLNVKHEKSGKVKKGVDFKTATKSMHWKWESVNETVSRSRAKDFKNVTIEFNNGKVYADIKGAKKIMLGANDKIFHYLTGTYSPENLKKVFSRSDIKDGEKAKQLIMKAIPSNVKLSEGDKNEA